MKVIITDGGRATAGFKGEAQDCVCRAVAIAAEMPYREVYDLINRLNDEHPPRGTPKRPRAWSSQSKRITRRLFEHLGWTWTPTMSVGSGCKVHLREGELPMGRLVVSVSKHLVAVVDGVLYDNHDSGRNGTRCVYGYWKPKL